MAEFKKRKMLLYDIFPCLHTLSSIITSINRIWDLKFEKDHRKREKNQIHKIYVLVKMVRAKLTRTWEGGGVRGKKHTNKLFLDQGSPFLPLPP